MIPSKRTLFLCFLIAFAGHVLMSQTAKVKVLTPEDAAAAKALFAQRADIDLQIIRLKERIAKQYTRDCDSAGKPPRPTWASDDYYCQYQDGWSGGIAFAEDFKAIVPRGAAYN